MVIVEEPEVVIFQSSRPKMIRWVCKDQRERGNTFNEVQSQGSPLSFRPCLQSHRSLYLSRSLTQTAPSLTPFNIYPPILSPFSLFTVNNYNTNINCLRINCVNNHQPCTLYIIIKKELPQGKSIIGEKCYFIKFFFINVFATLYYNLQT